MKQSKRTDLYNSCFVWPWRGANNEKISLKEAILKRKFSISYLIIIYGIISALGFASTRDCTSTWQFELYCTYSYWAEQLFTNPLLFFRSLFTMPYIHNSIDHIGFVTFGILLVVQSYEVRCGFKKTLFTFIFGYILLGPIFAAFFDWGLGIWPESEFFIHSFRRAWIGGSLGFYFVFGPLVFYTKRRFIYLLIPVGFEIFNIFILNISPQISFVHLASTGFGVLVKLLFDYLIYHKKWLKEFSFAP